MAVLYDLPAVIMVDHITKWRGDSTVQARFFGYNWDGELALSTDGRGFMIRRPGSVLKAHVFANTPVASAAGRLDMLGDRASIHPFIDVTTGPTTDLTLVTVMALAKDEGNLPTVSGRGEGSVFRLEVGGETVHVDRDVIRLG